MKTTLERPADSAGELSNVLTFPGTRPPSNVRMLSPTPEGYAPRTSGRQIASRKRNPLRHPCHSVSYAVTVIGKVRRNETLPDGVDGLAIIRKGAIAARQLADELDRILEFGGRAQQ